MKIDKLNPKLEIGAYHHITDNPNDWPNYQQIIWFDGAKWWLPGWECGLTISEQSSSFAITRDAIGDLIISAEDLKEKTSV